jgi:hypothetical protein
MDNYLVRFDESEREAVLNILARYNDVIINKVEPTSALITIQLDDSKPAYDLLMEQIDRELNAPDIIIEPVNQTDQNSNTGRPDHK